MTTFQIVQTDKGVFAHFNGKHKRTIRCPDKRAKKIKGMYYPDKMTIQKYNVPVLVVDGQERQCHELLQKRVWQTLWEDGWRQRK